MYGIHRTHFDHARLDFPSLVIWSLLLVIIIKNSLYLSLKRNGIIFVVMGRSSPLTGQNKYLLPRYFLRRWVLVWCLESNREAPAPLSHSVPEIEPVNSCSSLLLGPGNWATDLLHLSPTWCRKLNHRPRAPLSYSVPEIKPANSCSSLLLGPGNWTTDLLLPSPTWCRKLNHRPLAPLSHSVPEIKPANSCSSLLLGLGNWTTDLSLLSPTRPRKLNHRPLAPLS